VAKKYFDALGVGRATKTIAQCRSANECPYRFQDIFPPPALFNFLITPVTIGIVTTTIIRMTM
jgi:hypothetical protein